MEEIQEKIREIKRSFRLQMNGVASRSMREKGVGYHVNWGVPFLQLQEQAKAYAKDYSLAVALWKEDIRECKILATLLMPPEQMPREVVDIWMEQTVSQEMAEMQAFNLYQHLPYAPALAYEWAATDDPMKLIAAYNLFARLFAKGQYPNDRGIHEYLDQVLVALQDQRAGVRHAAMNSIQRFSCLGEEFEEVTAKALKSIGIDW